MSLVVVEILLGLTLLRPRIILSLLRGIVKVLLGLLLLLLASRVDSRLIVLRPRVILRLRVVVEVLLGLGVEILLRSLIVEVLLWLSVEVLLRSRLLRLGSLWLRSRLLLLRPGGLLRS